MKIGDIVIKNSSQIQFLNKNPFSETSEGIIFWNDDVPSLILDINHGSSSSYTLIKILTDKGSGWIYMNLVKKIND